MILCEMQADLGGNTVLAVSTKACKAGASKKELSLFF
jgi:enolase